MNNNSPKSADQARQNDGKQAGHLLDRYTVQPQSNDGNDSPFYKASAPTISLPKGGGALKGIDEKFSVNAVNGTAGLELPLPVTPGRGGFTPALSISYNSGSGNSAFGLGWNLSLPSIQRKTDKKLPLYNDTIESDVFLLAGAEDLVPVLDEEGEPAIVTIGSYMIKEYRPRIEGLFARIEYIRAVTGGAGWWRVTTKDNITTYYGLDYRGRIADPENGLRVFQWLPQLVVDHKGNVQQYTYVSDTNNSTVDIPAELNERNRLNGNAIFTNTYLKNVAYCNQTPYFIDADKVQPEEEDGPCLIERNIYQPDTLSLTNPLADAAFLMKAVLDYGDHIDGNYHDEAPGDTPNALKCPSRSDAFSSFQAGFEIRTYRKCRRALMFHYFHDLEDKNLVRALELHYKNDNDTEIFTEADLIISATQRGYDYRNDEWHSKTLPAMEFDYQPLQWNTDIVAVDKADFRHAPQGLTGPYQWIDFEGEGISGILTEQAGEWFYKNNLGDGHFSVARTIAEKPSFKGLNGGSLQWQDLDADGRRQVTAAEPVKGFWELDDEQEWAPFRTFAKNLNIDWNSPFTKMLDLNGDGRADVLVTEDRAWTWYENQGKQGFDQGGYSPLFSDEEKGPVLLLRDTVQSIFLADMNGDGMTDLVRIKNGEICYWPNMGYGKFGARVSMAYAPLFQSPDIYNPQYLSLADISGTGAADLIYVGNNKCTAWINLAGNAWSEAVDINPLPGTDNMSKIAVLDFLGNGTGCIVWSSPLPQHAHAPLQYIDLMGGIKPYLMTAYHSGTGKTVSVHYKSSTQFYLEDKANGINWATKLPFPVQCIETVTTTDQVSGTSYTQSYRYRHGYYDHDEREFRGFGYVETKDIESAIIDDDPLTGKLNQFPVLTKTWNHTGAWLRGNTLTDLFKEQYYPIDRWDNTTPVATFDGSEDYNAQELREACRALKGSALRQEVYALDGATHPVSGVNLEVIPYSITATSYKVSRIQEQSVNRYACFLNLQQQSVSFSCERDLSDARIAHQLTLETDVYGNVLKSAAIAYPRPEADTTAPGPVQDAQEKMHITYTENNFTNDVIEDNHYRLRVAYENISYELVVPKVEQPSGLWTAAGLLDAIDNADPIDFSITPDPEETDVLLKKIGHSKATFKTNAADAVLAFENIESLAIPHEQYRLAYTGDLRAALFSSLVNAARLQEGGFVTTYTNNTDSGPVDIGESGEYWIPSGTAKYNKTDTRFYTPTCYKDPWDNETHVQFWDKEVSPDNFVNYWLLPKATIDARGNTAGISDYDMRLLQPLTMYDINENISEILYDALGMPVAMALKGKGDNTEGDTLAGLDLYDGTDDDARYDFFHTDPEANADTLLKNATWRCVYDFSQTPVAVGMIARQTHYNPGAVSGTSEDRIIRISYSDGLGRVLMHKAQVAPDAATPLVPRWVGSGRTVYNNKGKAVMQFEPYFSDTHGCEAAELNTSIGVSPKLFYDALGRNYRTEMPDGTFTETAWTPWKQTVWDQNDTVIESNWYERRSTGGDLHSIAGEAEAALKAAAHAATPTVMHTDVLARPFYTIQQDGINDDIKSYVDLDIQGNRLGIVDGLRNTDTPDTDIRIISYEYNMLQQPCYQESKDSGNSYSLTDVAGQPLWHQDAAGNVFHMEYDILRRITQKWCNDLLQEEIFYGDTPGIVSDPEDLNIRGQVHHHCDSAGETSFPLGYDFKGNPKKTSLKLLADPTISEVDWDLSPPALSTETHESMVSFDALNRPVTATDPGGNSTTYTYDKGGALKTLTLNSDVYVQDIHYNAKGQRQCIWYGNSTKIKYTYDELTYRLRRLCMVKLISGGTHETLQDMNYYYDPVGNITYIHYGTEDILFYSNSMILPEQDFTYDALYRLIEASGREMDGSYTYDDKDHWADAIQSQPAANAARNYTQYYTYDAVGNILSLQHVATGGNYTRTYDYSSSNNRLNATHAGGEDYSYDHDVRGNFIEMPHLDEMVWNTNNELCAIERTGSLTAYYQYSGGQRLRKYVDKGLIKEERIYLGDFEIYRKFEGSSLKVQRSTVHVSDDTGRIAMLEVRAPGYLRSDDNDTEPTLTRYIYSNHLQSATLELDENADTISYEEYHPYGTTAYSFQDEDVKAVAKRYRYTGKERDEESGLYYHGARYYVPWLCRWCAVDPSEAKNAGKSSYQYCDSNPIVHIDPDGKDKITFHYLHNVHNGIFEKPDNRRDNTSRASFGRGSIVPTSGNTVTWLTIEKQDGPNTYSIEETTVNSYLDGKKTTISPTETTPITHPEYNFGYNKKFYKAVQDFRGVLSSNYPAQYRDPSRKYQASDAAAQVHNLLNRAEAYDKEADIKDKTNSMMLGLLGFAATELVVLRLAKGGSALFKLGKTITQASEKDRFVYRALTKANAESLAEGNGIFAKAPKGEWSLEEHLIRGSSPKSHLNDPWISTTTDMEIAESFSSGNGIIKIDLTKLEEGSIIRKGYETLPRSSAGYHYSVWQQETTVYQHIPQNAIQLLK